MIFPRSSNQKMLVNIHTQLHSLQTHANSAASRPSPKRKRQNWSSNSPLKIYRWPLNLTASPSRWIIRGPQRWNDSPEFILLVDVRDWSRHQFFSRTSPCSGTFCLKMKEWIPCYKKCLNRNVMLKNVIETLINGWKFGFEDLKAPFHLLNSLRPIEHFFHYVLFSWK